MEKTNVMRVLDSKKIKYNAYDYTDCCTTVGIEVALNLGQDPARVFKTLVTESKSNKYYVFVIPVACSLDLKKAAKAVGEKSVEMLKQKDLLPLTGYVHGGCSPIGMKKFFTTTFHKTLTDFDMVIFSAGKIGYQVEVPVESLSKVIRYQTADIIKDEKIDENI